MLMRRLNLSHGELMALPDGYDDVAVEMLNDEDREAQERSRR